MKREKTGGRKKGTPNKSSASLRQSIQTILENNIEQYQGDLNEMSAKDRVNSINNLMKFSLPQLKAQDVKMNMETNGVDESVLDEILKGIKDNEYINKRSNAL